ncbi:MFS transporter [Chloroflexota bacterium]
MIKKVFPILALSVFSSCLGMGIITPLLPIYSESLGATGIWVGVIFAGFSISRSIMMPIAGGLSDRRGPRLILGIGLIAFAVTSLGYVWADNVAGLLVARFLQGIAGGMIMPVAQAYVGYIAPRGEEGRWMGYYNMSLFTGMGTGPLIGGVLAEHFGINAAFYAMGCLNLLAFLGVILFLPEISHREKATDSHSSFKWIAKSNIMRGLFSFRLCISINQGTYLTFFPILAGIHLGLSTALIGVLITVNTLGMSLLQIAGGNLADRFNKRALVVLGCFVSLAAMVLLTTVTSFWQLLVLSLFQGIGGAISVPSASAMAVDEGRKFGMGVAMATFTLSLSVGLAIGPIMSGAVADFISIKAAFYFAAAAILVGIGAFSWFTR